jgi:CBS domain-containing protein
MDIQLNLNAETVEQAKSEMTLIVQTGAPVRDVLHQMRENDKGSVLICDGEKLLGVFTERDAVKLMAGDVNLDVAIDDLMIEDPVTIHRAASIADAVKLMSKGGYRRLPIVDDDDGLIGWVKVSGILSFFVDHFPETVFNLPPEPNVVMPEREGA